MLSAAAGIAPADIFADFRIAARSVVITAVSGGSDSLSLLFLLKDFLSFHAPATRLVAVTVDHGLRAESAREAAIVASLCEAHGIAHRITRWSGAKPEHGVPAAAREARYRLLAEAADAEGTDLVLTGHTLDDQLETIAMREARGDGRGLAGMAPATLFDGRVWILRPLLGTRRAALRGHLTDLGVRWIDDPTNVDEKYERARIRAAPRADDEGARRKIAAAATSRVALGEAAAGLIRAHAKRAAPGLFALQRSFHPHSSEEAGVYALRILLAAVGGAAHLPDQASAAFMFARMSEQRFRATLSRVVVDARTAAIFLRRERRGLPGPSRAAPGTLWDGRFRIGELPQGLSIAPAGTGRANVIARSDAPPFAITAGATPGLVASALATQPALWRDGEFVALAGETGAARPVVAPWARFLPSFDLAPAHAVAVLIGTSPPPEPPFAGHKGRGG